MARRGLLTVIAVALAGIGLVACGGSSDSGSDTASGDASPLAAVQSCLEDAGFGTTEIPAAELKEGAEHNRGPGQTGELLVGANGKQPAPEADESIAVVASWESEAAAADQVKLGKKYDSYTVQSGTLTLQPTTATQAQFNLMQKCLKGQ